MHRKVSFCTKTGVIVPSLLRSRILQNLHAAHQGMSMMEQRARAIVYWPRMSTDCNRNAPTQEATPPLPTTSPSTPFEAVFADFFTYGGRHYLVVGDRLSGWVEVFGSAGTTLAGAAGLIHHLRSFFATFGVPEELSSDGGRRIYRRMYRGLPPSLGSTTSCFLGPLSSIERLSRGGSKNSKAPSHVQHQPNWQP